MMWLDHKSQKEEQHELEKEIASLRTILHQSKKKTKTN